MKSKLAAHMVLCLSLVTLIGCDPNPGTPQVSSEDLPAIYPVDGNGAYLQNPENSQNPQNLQNPQNSQNLRNPQHPQNSQNQNYQQPKAGNANSNSRGVQNQGPGVRQNQGQNPNKQVQSRRSKKNQQLAHNSYAQKVHHRGHYPVGTHHRTIHHYPAPTGIHHYPAAPVAVIHHHSKSHRHHGHVSRKSFKQGYGRGYGSGYGQGYGSGYNRGYRHGARHLPYAGPRNGQGQGRHHRARRHHGHYGHRHHHVNRYQSPRYQVTVNI